MIKIKISELLGKHKMTQKELSEKANIRPNTVSALYHETIKRLDIGMLDRICNVLNCKLEDIIEHIPNKE